MGVFLSDLHPINGQSTGLHLELAFLGSVKNFPAIHAEYDPVFFLSPVGDDLGYQILEHGLGYGAWNRRLDISNLDQTFYLSFGQSIGHPKGVVPKRRLPGIPIWFRAAEGPLQPGCLHTF